ncbi:4a-hydroxytetrahydrobiopterin dehydratase [Amphritea atlantica]|uniref:Putative pterin-4-alpha-carbinolamine dehydratase n=1 Tax=Amphritea atlantica TaxID=355243 RepID=A0A1H9EK80_9GAMM|nr:4a-hydroxytetrahydrobiopterin dehydratase [Amphritea atlantica]SEQ26140.1 4a-hydroxytetrahydrobiopterin dehydratase [Amphritea atlantica]
MADDLLKQRRCVPCDSTTPALTPQAAEQQLKRLASGWSCNEVGTEICKKFLFKDFYHTMAFVNALAWIAHQEDHHPDLEVGYNRCVVRFSTHAIGGLSINDFICAAKTDDLQS